jgi:hypothetical protein
VYERDWHGFDDCIGMNIFLKVPFDVMCETLDKIDEDFVNANGIVDYNFDKKCKEFMSACGWSQAEYEFEVHRRWNEICDGIINRTSHRAALS